MIVRNRGEIATSELRSQVLDIIEAGISRVLAPTLMTRAVTYEAARRALVVQQTAYDVSAGRLFVVGGGKASGLMAETLETLVGARNITAGIVNCIDSRYNTDVIRVIEASHPTPDERGQNGVEEMLSLKQRHSAGRDDLFLCLVSGGGSALMPLPAQGLTLGDKQVTTRLLLGSGADIREINCVRKHLSGVKGGRLGRFLSPSRVVSLIISDVVGNNLESIASGPTAPDSSTFSDACDILHRYRLTDEVPARVLDFLTRGRDGKEDETPKTLDNCSNHIIGDNMMALQAMSERAAEMGFTPRIVTAEQTGDTTAAAEQRAREILEGKYAGNDVILIGGETTPTLPATPGKGGRNQHYVAASMLAMEEYERDWALASVGTDGFDFGRDAAGALVDSGSMPAARARNIDFRSYLDAYDSNTLLKALGNSLVVMGNTGTNVGDIVVYVLR
jgi:glycerate 2-kinase